MEVSAESIFDFKPDLPVAISCVGGRYLLFDVKIATWLRREHNICGTMVGSLPLSPSQNVFLGMPVEIMPEEAQLLSERGIGTIVDDARAHDQAIQSADRVRRADYLERLRKQAKQVENIRIEEKAKSKKRGLEKQSQKAANSSASSVSTAHSKAEDSTSNLLDFDDGSAPIISAAEPPIEASRVETSQTVEESPIKTLPTTTISNTYEITPATSRLLLPTPPRTPTPTPASTISNLPSSYPLYRHLHNKGFFTTPGLRFGCQYSVYPGDPLRFHAHFLAVGRQWDEEIDLMDIVGGGRLGTGVKKGFLVGGESPGGDVRTFSVEWAAM